MKRILLVDNYDSFTYNVLHLIKRVCNTTADIVKNDKIDFSSLNDYTHIIISPGPGIPSESGDVLKVIELCKESHSILGICLGHQAIAECFGGKLINLPTPLHGHKSELIINSKDPVLSKLKISNNTISVISIGLYHSWAVDDASIGNDLKVGSKNEDGIVMTLYHRIFNIYGMQFHPESVITERGEEIFRCWWEL